MLKITISSPIPIYEQLISGIVKMIENGQIEPGDSLPSIRNLAKQLDIAVNTVARAYMELERRGITISNGRKGSFVKHNLLNHSKETETIFKEPLRKLIREGLDKEDIIRIFNKNLSEIFN